MVSCDDVVDGVGIVRISSGVHGTIEHVDRTVSILIGVGIALVSAALLLQGYKILRPTAALVGAAAAFAVVCTRATWIGQCELILGVAAVSALCVALSIAFLLRTGIVITGAMAFGLSAYVLYRSTVPDTLVSIQWAGMSALLWATLAASAVMGGVIVYFGRDRVYILASAALGGVGMCAGVVTLAHPHRIPTWAILAVMVSSASIGGAVQYRLYARARRRPCITEAAEIRV